MKKDLTELVFILDRSGSMRGLEKETIMGFNSMIEKQKSEEGKALVTTILFDHEIEVIHERKSIDEIRKMTDEDYYVRGYTALLDAIGYGIEHVEIAHSHEEDRLPDKTLFVIITDGEENSSSRFTPERIRKMIKEQKRKKWEILFIGANIDAEKEAGKIGIEKDHAVDYIADREGTELNYKALGSAISGFRNGSALPSSWKNEIMTDTKRRKH